MTVQFRDNCITHVRERFTNGWKDWDEDERVMMRALDGRRLQCVEVRQEIEQYIRDNQRPQQVSFDRDQTITRRSAITGQHGMKWTNMHAGSNQRTLFWFEFERGSVHVFKPMLLKCPEWKEEFLGNIYLEKCNLVFKDEELVICEAKY
jgi:hypothetical protein